MKKITLIFICVVFVASIFIVNFFGLPVKDYSKTIFVQEINIENVQVGPNATLKKSYEKNGTYYIEVEFKTNYDSEDETKNFVMITPRVTDDATDKTLKYVYDTEDTKAFFVENSPIPVVCFREIKRNNTVFSFSLEANDGNRVSQKIKIIVSVNELQ